MFDVIRPLIERRQRLERQRNAIGPIVGRLAHALATNASAEPYRDHAALVRACALGDRYSARISELVRAQDYISVQARAALADRNRSPRFAKRIVDELARIGQEGSAAL